MFKFKTVRLFMFVFMLAAILAGSVFVVSAQYVPEDLSDCSYVVQIDDVMFLRDQDNLRRLSYESYEIYGPWVSPDGEKLLYLAETPKRLMLKVRELRSGAVLSEFQVSQDTYVADWVGNDRVAYRELSMKAQHGDLYISDTKGANRFLLAEHVGSPAVSPDGTLIVYQNLVDHLHYIIKIEEGAQPEKMSDFANWAYDSDAGSFSPDGRYVVFQASEPIDEQYGLYFAMLYDVEAKTASRIAGSDHTYYPRFVEDNAIAVSGSDLVSVIDLDGNVLWSKWIGRPIVYDVIKNVPVSEPVGGDTRWAGDQLLFPDDNDAIRSFDAINC